MSEQLKNKLQNFEVTPPPGVWSSIATELNQNDLPFARKMYEYQAVPPAGAWENIINRLGSDTNQVPFPALTAPGSTKPIYKMAVAAAVLGVIVLGGWYFFHNNVVRKQNLSAGLVEHNTDETRVERNESLDVPRVNPLQQAQLALSLSYPVTKSKKKFNPAKARKLNNAIVRNVRGLRNKLATMIAAKPIRNANGDIIQDVDLMNNDGDKYIAITGPNGEQTKISSKFVNALLYLNESGGIEEYEGYFDKTFLESLMWKSRFQDWRNKIIQNSFIPSSTNFLDILEFKELLNETKNQ